MTETQPYVQQHRQTINNTHIHTTIWANNANIHTYKHTGNFTYLHKQDIQTERHPNRDTYSQNRTEHNKTEQNRTAQNIHTHKYMQTYIQGGNTDMHTHIQQDKTYSLPYRRPYIHTYIHTDHKDRHTGGQADCDTDRSYIHTYKPTKIQSYIHTYIHTYRQAYKPGNTYIHTCTH